MKNNKGVTLITLVIVIIVLVILAGIVGINAKKDITEAGLKEFAIEVNQLEYLIKQYKIRNDGNIDFQPYIIDVLTADEEMLSQMEQETISEGEITLYKIDYEKIDAMQTRYGNKIYSDDDIYLVSNETERVYYIKGYQAGSNVYYTVTDDIRNKLLITGTN